MRVLACLLTAVFAACISLALDGMRVTSKAVPYLLVYMLHGSVLPSYLPNIYLLITDILPSHSFCERGYPGIYKVLIIQAIIHAAGIPTYLLQAYS